MSIAEVCAFISSGVIIIVPPKSKRFENEANVTLLSLYPVKLHSSVGQFNVPEYCRRASERRAGVAASD